jgi:hypothetical protein
MEQHHWQCKTSHAQQQQQQQQLGPICTTGDALSMSEAHCTHVKARYEGLPHTLHQQGRNQHTMALKRLSAGAVSDAQTQGMERRSYNTSAQHIWQNLLASCCRQLRLITLNPLLCVGQKCKSK